MTDLYHDIETLSEALQLLSKRDEVSTFEAYRSISQLLKQKAREAAEYEKYLDTQAAAYEDGRAEGQVA